MTHVYTLKKKNCLFSLGEVDLVNKVKLVSRGVCKELEAGGVK